MKAKEVVTIEIEEANGNTLMAFTLNSDFQVGRTQDCSVADIDGDYIFETGNDLVRVQSDTIGFNRELVHIENDVFHGLSLTEIEVLSQALATYHSQAVKNKHIFEVGSLARVQAEDKIASSYNLLERLKAVQ